MLFNSLEFLVFFPIVVALYFAIPNRFRWILLLVASYYFYMCWNYKYVLLIVVSTIVDYSTGILIHKSQKKGFRKLLLFLSLGTNLGLLFFFKYFNFFSDSLNGLFEHFNIFMEVPAYDFLLPVGISFYTFQTLSYTIDIYKKKQEPEYHFGRFALFVSFFPQLVAGPIERSVNLLPQFRKEHFFDYERVKRGVLLMGWGFFKKVVIADRLAEYVNVVYNNPTDFEGLPNIIATFFFSFQIYCDFSGYSDIAIGAAMVMGYTLMTNFRRPYFAQNIRAFWQRWHISLSTWFRDYVYISMGGNRVVKWRWYYNLFITFVVSGLWHGANWTFVIWGAIHGFYLVFAIWTGKFRDRFNSTIGLARLPRLYSLVQVLITFALVYISWIFFRANDVGEAIYILKNHFVFSGDQEINLFRVKSDFIISFLGIAVLLLIDFLEEKHQLTVKLDALPRITKWVLLGIFVFTIFLFAVWNETDFPLFPILIELTMSEKTLKRIIFVWGAISLVLFVAVRVEPLFNGLLVEKVVPNYWDKTKYGEMYYFSMIKHFRESGLPPAHPKFEFAEKHASVGEADILTFGDSFFEFSRHKQIPERLADDFGKRVHYVNFDFPLSYLAANKYSSTKPRIVLYERTERYIPVSFQERQMLPESLPSDDEKSLPGRIKDLIFYDKSEELYNIILKRSYASTAIYSFFTTLRFDLYGSISSLTPVYTVKDSNNWLFYHDQVNDDITSFYYKHSPEDMERICDNMEDLSRVLKEQYNLYLIYLPIPAKYTLYHGLVNDDPYNGFLPKLYRGLDQRGVKYVNVYDDFKNSKDTLYYKTDSHWKQNGLDIAYELTIDYIKSDSLLNSLLN